MIKRLSMLILAVVAAFVALPLAVPHGGQAAACEGAKEYHGT